MSQFLRSYFVVAMFGATALLLAGLLLGISGLLRPSRPSREKLLPYESGVDAIGDGWTQSQIRYYVFALLFVIFDVEAVFIFPWAITFLDLPKYVFYEMLLFIGVLALGLGYAWRRGVLEWR